MPLSPTEVCLSAVENVACEGTLTGCCEYPYHGVSLAVVSRSPMVVDDSSNLPTEQKLLDVKKMQKKSPANKFRLPLRILLEIRHGTRMFFYSSNLAALLVMLRQLTFSKPLSYLLPAPIKRVPTGRESATSACIQRFLSHSGRTISPFRERGYAKGRRVSRSRADRDWPRCR